MNVYRQEWERQHGKKKKTPVGVFVFAGFVFCFTVLCLLVMVSRAETGSGTETADAPRIIYQDENLIEAMNRKVTMVGIAPGVNIYVPDCDESFVQNGGANGGNGIGNAESDVHLHEYSNISISDSEMDELRRIVAAEAQNQSMEGREAVVEVIFNRVLSPEWPDTVHGVLSQRGQFATWKLRYASWVVPDAAVAAIEYVMQNGRTVLPDTSYVYFDTRGTNGSSHIKIGAHYFGR